MGVSGFIKAENGTVNRLASRNTGICQANEYQNDYPDELLDFTQQLYLCIPSLHVISSII